MPSEVESSRLAFPAGWVRCAWCKEIIPYNSTELKHVKRRGSFVYMHAKCAHEAELTEWGGEPPMHGAD